MMDDLLHEMIDPAPAPRDLARRRRLWTTVIIVGLAVIGATTLTTSALFTDDDATSASIRTGNIDLVVGQTVPFAVIPEGLAPGDSTFVPLTVSNAGSLQLRYSISYSGTPGAGTGTGDLSNILELSMFQVDEAACNVAGTTGLTPINNTQAPVTNWPTAANPAPLVGVPGARPADGNDRTLPGGNTTESLCARVFLPLAAGNEYQDTSVTLDLLFNAEQTANNP